MIRVILSGRTGNNFFQYAAGRALAIRHQTRLILDGAWMDTYHATQHAHLLRLPIAATYERRMTVVKRGLRKVLHLGPEHLHQGTYYRESQPEFDPSFSHLPAATILDGYFQCLRYFEPIASKLRAELDLQTIRIPEISRKFEDQLRARAFVSIHLRRGDYLTFPGTQCLTPGYHEAAIDHFRERWDNLRFCIFSDDIPWCRQHFTRPGILFCDLPGSAHDPLHDMRLMSACQHHIIVNSSYSWWGAWLNASPDRVVIAPAMWMQGRPSTPILPAAWIRM